MSFIPEYLIDIDELNNQLQYFNEAISENLNEGGLVDRRFSGALVLIQMLFEKIEKLSSQLGGLSGKCRELQLECQELRRHQHWSRKHFNRLLRSHWDLRDQVEANHVALNRKIDDLVSDFEKLKI